MKKEMMKKILDILGSTALSDNSRLVIAQAITVAIGVHEKECHGKVEEVTNEIKTRSLCNKDGPCDSLAKLIAESASLYLASRTSSGRTKQPIPDFYLISINNDCSITFLNLCPFCGGNVR